MNKKAKAILLLSGGLDSSLAGAILKRENIEVLAIRFITGLEYSVIKEELMEIYNNDPAKKIADFLNIPIRFISLKDKYIDIKIKALSARYTPTRRAALNNLRGINYEYLNNYIHIIEGCYKREVNKELKQSIIRFLDGLNSKKKRQYENIGDVRVSPYTKDAFLTITKVEDMDKFDLTIVENKIRSGALVYLKRDKDNAEAENAIMVLTEKGYLLGYVSKENNYILKNLMDWGKILYGQIKKVDEDYKSMEIKVYLSYVDVMREVKDTFNMVTDQSMGYLN